MIAKLTFFKNASVIFKGYFVVFQTDNPMIPFLSDALEGMIRKIMNMFIRKDVLSEANTVRKVIKIDVENRLPVGMVNRWTAVKAIVLSEEITDRSIYQFRKDCVVFLTQLILKRQERSPLKYLIIRCSSSLSPINMVQKQQKATTQFSYLIENISLIMCCLLLQILLKRNLRNIYLLLLLPRITSCNLTFSSQEVVNSWELISRIKQFYEPFVNLFSHSHIASM